MIKSIVKKEWLKLRFYLIGLFVLCLGSILYFVYNLNFSFSTIEPESIMWYRFVDLEQKPYYIFSYMFLFISIVISFAQFLPEKIKNRVKIMTHLPMSLNKAILMHVGIGLLYIFVLSVLLSFFVGSIIFHYYTYEIFLIMLKDFSFYILGSFIFYVALSAAIIENNKTMSFIKLFIGSITIFVYFKNRYYYLDVFWIFILIAFLLVVLDSFYSIKKQRLQNYISMIVLFLGISFIFYNANLLYQEKYNKIFNKYYIFYSAPLKEFIYQKNFGDHRFSYGIKDKGGFGRIEYESQLPFVYWRNLDIQNKLPILIDAKEYDKQTIKKNRLSFSYSPVLLKDKELRLYPLLNPNSKVGMIKFPEHMIQFNALHVKVYNYDQRLNPILSKEINSLFIKNDIKMPIKNIWGKATNMKPYDLGYFFLDSENRLFNIKRRDNIVSLNEIKYPQNIEIKYIKISENKQRKVAGYAIDSDSNFYLIDWELNFKKLELNGFDYKTMKLQFISNALYYLVRYDDRKNYNAVVFTKELEKIEEIKMK